MIDPIKSHQLLEIQTNTPHSEPDPAGGNVLGTRVIIVANRPHGKICLCVATDTIKNLFESRGGDKDDEMGHRFIDGLFNSMAFHSARSESKCPITQRQTKAIAF